MKIYGIDLGTCMSSIAHIDEHQKPVVLLNNDAEPLTNSAVWFESPGNTIVGRMAYDNAGGFADQVVLHVKSKMGQMDSEHNPVTINVAGNTYTPEEISARILKELARYGEIRTKEKIADVIITVPAYFGAAENKATKNAGEIAGFTVHETLPEPVAAALAYGFDNPQKQSTLLVYDLGGGTFDITLLKLSPPLPGEVVPQVEMITTGGNRSLGGMHWDMAIRDYVVDEFKKAHPDAEDPAEDAESFQKLYIDCEHAKKELWRRPSKTIVYYHPQKGGFKVELTREKLLEITSFLLARTESQVDLIFQTVRERHEADPATHPLIALSDVDNIILAGGSTRLLMVQEMLEKHFPGKLIGFDKVDPDQCVSIGAAWYGWLKSRGGRNPVEVASHSIGVLAEDPNDGKVKVFPLILKDAKLPVRQADDSFCTKGSGTSVTVNIFQNDSATRQDLHMKEQSVFLGKVEVTGLPSGREPGKQVEVTLELRPGSQLAATAKDVETGLSATANIVIGSGITEEGIARARKVLAEEAVNAQQ